MFRLIEPSSGQIQNMVLVLVHTPTSDDTSYSHEQPHLTSAYYTSNTQGVPGGMCQTSGECSLS